jgi:hypothetical protein
MSLFNWGKKKEEPQTMDNEKVGDIVEEDIEEDIEEEEEVEIRNLPVVVAKPEQRKVSRDIAVRKPSNSIVVREAKRELVEYRPRTIMIGKEEVKINFKQLIRGIKQVTQTIGEYKNSETPYAKFVIHGLRKVRSDMVSELEHHFGIHWEIDEQSGQSVFYK